MNVFFKDKCETTIFDIITAYAPISANLVLNELSLLLLVNLWLRFHNLYALFVWKKNSVNPDQLTA